MLVERIAPREETLGLISQQQLRVEQLLQQCDDCEANLRNARIEVAGLRADTAQYTRKCPYGCIAHHHKPGEGGAVRTAKTWLLTDVSTDTLGKLAEGEYPIMVIEDRPEERDEINVLNSTGSGELARVEIGDPTAPKDMPDHEKEELKTKALALVTDLGEASGSRELELSDSITSLGIQAQRAAGGELDLLKTRVGDMLSQEGPSGKIANDLVELRVALNQINPHELREASGIRKIFSFIPFINKFTPALKVAERIAVRYEPASKQVSVIETHLREGRQMLARDNVELRKLYAQVESQQGPIQKNAFLGELVMQQLSELLERTDDTLKAERVRNALSDVSSRVQDLRTMETVHTQFFVSIEMTRQNNNRLGQSVERTLALGSNVVMVGLAIQSALTRQEEGA